MILAIIAKVQMQNYRVDNIPKSVDSRALLDILIIDDDYELLEMLEEALASAGLSLRTAATLREAASAIELNTFRCLLVDQNLRDGRGIDLLADLQSKRLESIPILMTGEANREIVRDAINLGNVFRFLLKPFEMNHLRKCVEEAIVRYDTELGKRQHTREMEQQNQLLRAESRSKRAEIKEVISSQGDSAASDDEREWVEIQIQKAYLQTIASLTRAIDAKDRYTHGHSERVYYYCSLIAEILDLSESSRNDLRFASVLHDIGKIGIPDEILLKKAKLSESEFDEIAQHPLLSESIISPLPFLDKVRRIVRHHHEHFDGSGYPDSLNGSEIPLEARILAVADAYDAMRSNRPYRGALSRETAKMRLLTGEGSQFCPVCVRAFLIALEQKGDYELSEMTNPLTAWESGAFIEVSPRLQINK